MFPFTRTTCACKECVDCCKRQPGPLIPGDFEKIAEYLGVTLEELKAHFVASPGAQVMNSATGRIWRIGSITPKMIRGRCVFLDEDDRCRIHAVAPAGCAFFDTHMGLREAQPRGNEMARQQQDPEYQRLRSTLKFADNPKSGRY